MSCSAAPCWALCSCSCWRRRAPTLRFSAGNYTLLVVLNCTLLVLLMALVGYQLWRLRKNLKEGRLRIAAGRAACSAVRARCRAARRAALRRVDPVFSARASNRGSNVRVDRALEGGLNLGRNALEYLLKETTNKATQLALTLQEGEPGGLASNLNRASEQAGIYEAALFSSSGGVLAVGGVSGSTATPEPPPPQGVAGARVCNRRSRPSSRRPIRDCCCGSSCPSTAPTRRSRCACFRSSSRYRSNCSKTPRKSRPDIETIKRFRIPGSR